MASHQTRLTTSIPNPGVNRTLWQWLALGLLALTLFPDVRGYDAWMGWLPFWAVIAPVAALAALHRHVLMAAWRTVLVRAPRRRRQRGANHQAQRSGFGAVSRRQTQRAA